jgi:hypothetical protein
MFIYLYKKEDTLFTFTLCDLEYMLYQNIVLMDQQFTFQKINKNHQIL